MMVKMDSAIRKFETRKKKLEDQLTLLGRNILGRYGVQMVTNKRHKEPA